MEFQKAARARAKARIGLVGPSGSGKTYSALSIAQGLGNKIALVDTEHGSASLYADEFTFDTLELTNFNPQHYIDAIAAAGKAGYDVLILDSLSHAWAGTDGALELVDRAAVKAKGNKFVAWRDVTPLHNKLIEAMLACPCHLIATMRSKTEYVQDKESGGKTVIRKVGTVPIQREGMEYEFSIVGDLDIDHHLVISKTRYKGFDGAVLHCPGAEFGRQIRNWLEQGLDLPAKSVEPKAEKPSPARAMVFSAIRKWALERALDPAAAEEAAKAILREAYRVESCAKLAEAQWMLVQRNMARLTAAIGERMVPATETEPQQEMATNANSEIIDVAEPEAEPAPAKQQAALEGPGF